MERSSPGVSSGCVSMSAAMAGRSRCQAPGPWTGVDGQRPSPRPTPGHCGGIHSGFISRRPTAGPRLAGGRDPDHHERLQTFRCPDREAECGHRPHRETDRVERAQAEAVHGGTPARSSTRPSASNPFAASQSIPAVAARVGRDRAGRPRPGPAAGPRTSRGRWSTRRGAGPAAARLPTVLVGDRPDRWRGSSASTPMLAPAPDASRLGAGPTIAP